MMRFRTARAVWMLMLAGGFSFTMASPAGAAALSVQASNFRFCADGSTPCSPAASALTTTVPAGSTVTWFYRDTACDALAPCPGHNVVFNDVKGETAKKQGGALLKRRFETAGTYSYVCTIHQGFGMTGSVVVQAASTETTVANANAAGATSTTAAPRVAGATLPATGVSGAGFAVGASFVLLGLACIAVARRSRVGFSARE